MIFQPLRSWLISGVPLGQVRTKFHEGEVYEIIFGWTAFVQPDLLNLAI
jgi:hypothetical protein